MEVNDGLRRLSRDFDWFKDGYRTAVRQIREYEAEDVHSHYEGQDSRWYAKAGVLYDRDALMIEPDHAREIAFEILALADLAELAR